MEEFEKMLSSESFKKYPCFTREDFFDYMIEAGVERSIARNTYDQIRKGYAVSNNKHQAQLFSLPVSRGTQGSSCKLRISFSSYGLCSGNTDSGSTYLLRSN